MGLVVEHVNKSFAHFQVIKDLSMEVLGWMCGEKRTFISPCN